MTAAFAGLAREEIKFPSTTAEVAASQVDFYAMARLPKVISAIDCTHVRMQSFGGDCRSI